MNILRLCNKIIEYSFYALFFFVPLALTNSNSELFELTKMWLTWGLTIIIATAWICKMIVLKRFVFQRTPLDIPLVLFLLSQIISSIFSLDTRVSLFGYYSRFNGGLLSLVSYVFLYYAFVSNVFANKKAEESSPGQFRLSFFAGAISTGFLGFFLTIASKTPFFLVSSVVISFFLFVLAYRAWPLYRVFYICLVSGLLVVLWGLPSHFGNDPTCLLFRQTFDVSCWTEAFRPTIRIFSTLGQPAWLAAYMAVLLPIAIAFTIKALEDIHQNKRQIYVSIALYLLLISFLFYFSQWLLAFFAGVMPLGIILLVTKLRSQSSYFLTLAYLPLLSTLFYLSLTYANTRAGFIGFWIASLFFWLVLFILNLFSGKRVLAYAIVFSLSFAFLNFLFGLPIGQLQRYTLHNFLGRINITAHAQTGQQQTQQQNTQQPQPASLDSGITDSGKIRLLVWKGAIDIWKANPLFGSGVETYAFAYYKHRPTEHNMTSEWDYLYNKAHNEHLNYLATTGAFGLGTYLLLSLWFFVVAGKRLLQQKNQTGIKQEHTLLIIALLAGFIAIHITNFFGFSVVIMNLYLFLIPAFVFTSLPDWQASLAPPGRFSSSLNVKEAEQTMQAKQATSSKISGLQWVSILLLVLFAGYLLLLLFTFWRADRAYALGYNLDRVGDYQGAYARLKQAVAMRSSEPVFKDEYAYNNIALALSLYQANQATTAASLAQTAIALNNEIVTNYPNNLLFWKNRVRIFYTLGQLDTKYMPTAIQAIQKAHELAPTDAKISYNLGVILGQAGQTEQAVKILEETIRLKPDYQDAYYALGLMYRQLATDGGTVVVKPKLQEKAVKTMRYILDKLNPKNQQVIDELKKWGEL